VTAQADTQAQRVQQAQTEQLVFDF